MKYKQKQLNLTSSQMININANDTKQKTRGAQVAQSVKRQTSAQVMILWFVGSSLVLGSVMTARILEPASDTVS